MKPVILLDYVIKAAMMLTVEKFQNTMLDREAVKQVGRRSWEWAMQETLPHGITAKARSAATSIKTTLM